jgi:hypothetical protein
MRKDQIEEILALYQGEDTGEWFPQTMYYQCVEALGVHMELPNLPYTGENAVLIAEAINLAAKTIDSDFYSLKAMAFAAAAASPDVECWWGKDGVLYLFHAGTGEVSGHDPYGEISRTFTDLGIKPPVYSHDWSGIYRQTWAFLALWSSAARRVLAAAGWQEIFSDTQVHRILGRIQGGFA